MKKSGNTKSVMNESNGQDEFRGSIGDVFAGLHTVLTMLELVMDGVSKLAHYFAAVQALPPKVGVLHPTASHRRPGPARLGEA